MKKCKWHLCDNEVIGQKNKQYCSTKCKDKQMVTNHRRAQKEKAVEYKGGCCQVCGYNKYVGALQFHHLDPNEKDFHLAEGGATRSWEKVKDELDKCVCLCSNCHAEVHAGVLEL